METKSLNTNKADGKNLNLQKLNGEQEQKKILPKVIQTFSPVQTSDSLQAPAPTPNSLPAPLVENIGDTVKSIDTTPVITNTNLEKSNTVNIDIPTAPINAITKKIKKKKSKHLEHRDPFVAKIAHEFNLNLDNLKYNKVIRLAEKRFVPISTFLIEKMPKNSRKYGILKIKDMVRKEIRKMKHDPTMSSEVPQFLLKYLDQFGEYLLKYNRLIDINISKKIIDKVKISDFDYILSHFEFDPW